MNILQVLPELKIGGVETGTIDLAKELIRQGHKAVVISNGGGLVRDLRACGGIHYALPVHEKSPITVYCMIKEIAKIIKKEGIEIVHARSRVPAFSAFFAASLSKVPFITTCHGHYSRHLLSRVMGWGKFVIVASNVVARHMINNFNVPREKIRLIPRGVDLEKFSYKEAGHTSTKKEYIIGVIGRITPIKGHVYFIRAISKVARLMPNIKVHIIGDAPSSKPKYRQELEMLVRRLSLSKYIHFLGERNDIPKQMAKMDLVVMPSIGEETFGRVIIEAQAQGVPVIATKVGGIIDVIKDRENGILVPPKDWNRLSEAIIELLKDNDLKSKLSKAGRASVEKNFSLSRMYNMTIKVYDEAFRSFRILIIKWSALGDIILSLPALKAIRAKFPKSDIVLLTSPAGRELLSRYPYIKEFLIYKQKRGLESLQEVLDISSDLRKQSIDLVIDLQNNKKSHLFSFLSFAPRRIGYKTGKLDFLLNEAIGGARINMAPINHQFRLLKPLGIDSIPSLPQLIISKEEEECVDQLLAEGWVGKDEILIGLNCGSSQRWQTKRYSVEKLARLCDLLSQKKMRVVITGTKLDMPLAKRLLMLTRSKPLNLTGKTSIMQLAAVVQRCNAFITPDSGPMHIAALLGIKFVALFGPTDPKRHLEPCTDYRIIYKKAKCSPCYRSKCSDMKCMESITPEEIVTAVKELLEA